MPTVETRTIISLANGCSLLPKSVVQEGDQQCVFILTRDSSFWIDRFVAKRTNVNILKTDKDSVLVSENFDPTVEFIVLGKVDLDDGAYIKHAEQ